MRKWRAWQVGIKRGRGDEKNTRDGGRLHLTAKSPAPQPRLLPGPEQSCRLLPADGLRTLGPRLLPGPELSCRLLPADGSTIDVAHHHHTFSLIHSASNVTG